MEPEIIKVQADVSELEKSLDQVDRRFGVTEDSAKGLGDTTVDASKKAAKSLDEVTAALRREEAEQKRLTSIIREQEKITSEFRQEMIRLTRAYNESGKSGTLAGLQIKKQMDALNLSIKDQTLSVQQLKRQQADQKNVVKDLKAQETQLKKNTNQTSKFDSALSGLAKRVAVAFAAERIFAMVVSIGELAIQMEQLDQKAKIVFEDALPMVTRESERSANAIGLTAREFRSAAAGVADILVPLGFTRQASAELAVETTKLAGAISNWSGGQFTAAQSTEILQKALVGETEQLKSVGIVVDQSSKQFNERIKLLQETEGLTLQQARALDILNQVTNQSADAQTAFAEGSENMAVKLSIANARAREANEAFTEMITPLMVSATDSYASAIGNVADVGSSNLSTFEKLAAIISGFGGGIGGVNGLDVAAMRAREFAASLQEISDNGRDAQSELAAMNQQLRVQLGLEEEVSASRVSILQSIEDNIKNYDKLIKEATDEGEIYRLNALRFQEITEQQRIKQNLTEQELKLQTRLNAILNEQKNIEALQNEDNDPEIEFEQDFFENFNARADAAEEANKRIKDSTDALFDSEIEAAQNARFEREEIDAAQADFAIAQAQRQKEATIAAVSNMFETFKILAGDNAEAQKAIAVFEATINAALAISKTLATVPPPAGPILAVSIGALAAAQISKITSEQVPSFYTGTDYVALNGNKPGRDTVPAMLNEGEGVVTTKANRQWKGVVKAMNAGNFDQYITVKHVQPALKALRQEQEREKAALITAAIKGTINAKLDDARILGELKRSRHVNEEMAYLLARGNAKKNPYRK